MEGAEEGQGTQVVDMVPVNTLGEGSVSLLMPPPPPPPPQNLPPGCPAWAMRLRDCEVMLKLFFIYSQFSPSPSQHDVYKHTVFQFFKVKTITDYGDTEKPLNG